MMKKLRKKIVKIKKSILAFTLTELLVTIAIVAAVGAIGFFYLYNFKQVNALDQAAQSTVAALRYSQNQAVAGDRAEKWGVYVKKDAAGQDYFAIYFGGTFATGTMILKSPYATGIAVRATEDVNFTQLSGTIPVRKTITLYLVSNPLINRIITIDGIGSVSILENQPQNLVWVSPPTIIDGGGSIGTALDLGSDGFARILYYYSKTPELRFFRCVNESCLSKVGPTSFFGNLFSPNLTMGLDDFPRISYHQWTVGMEFVRCTNADCTSKITSAIENQIFNFLNGDLKIGTDGFARMTYSYADSNEPPANFTLRYARCTNDNCSSKNLTTIDSGMHSSFALGPDGFARVVYSVTAAIPNKYVIKFARCLNADCNSKNITVIDPDSSGYYMSLNVGSDGLPRIAYRFGAGVKFVRCMNEDCSLRNITTVDSGADNGSYLSSAIGYDDLVRIVYLDDAGGGGKVKFVQCLDSDCATKTMSVIDSEIFPTYEGRISIVLDDNDAARIVYYDLESQFVGDFKFAYQNIE